MNKKEKLDRLDYEAKVKRLVESARGYIYATESGLLDETRVQEYLKPLYDAIDEVGKINTGDGFRITKTTFLKYGDYAVGSSIKDLK